MSVARLVALMGMIALIVLALMTILDVSMRWLFNSPIDGVADVGPLVAAIVVASTFPLAVAGRHNVSIAFLGSWLGPRANAWIDVLAALVASVFFVLLAWQFANYVATLDARGQTTWVLRWPVAPWWTVVAVFIVLSAVMQIILLLTLMARAWTGGRDLAPSSQGRSPNNGGS